MAATGGLHRPMNRVAEGPGTGPVTYLGPLPGEGGVVGVAASNRDNHWRVPGFHRGPESTISPTNILIREAYPNLRGRVQRMDRLAGGCANPRVWALPPPNLAQNVCCWGESGRSAEVVRISAYSHKRSFRSTALERCDCKSGPARARATIVRKSPMGCGRGGRPRVPDMFRQRRR